MEKKYNNGFVSMAGDLFHSNHVKFLRKCKERCNRLTVGLYTDKQIESYKRYPILNINQREMMLESCRYVDKVIIEPPLPVTDKFLKDNKFDVYIHAHDKDDEKINWVFKNIDKKLCLRLDYNKGISTTKIIEIIKNR